jgi:hypothetical protein
MPGTPTRARTLRTRTSPTTGQPFERFHFGRTVATPGALGLLESSGVSPIELLMRHGSGDWGEIDPEDHGLNEDATRTGARVFSVYKLPAGTVWIITDGDDSDGVRHATTILLPDEY